MYIEGVKDGRQFVQALTEAAGTKPMIILKGGQTTAGTRATKSHTGSLAGSIDIWEALFCQAGAMQVGHLDELIDLALAFAYLSCPRGRRVGIVTFGGGRGVLSADECEGAGLIVPQFPAEVTRKLREFTPDVGTNMRNPVDSAARVLMNLQYLSQTLEIVARSEVVDSLIFYMYAEFLYIDTPHLMQQHVEAAAEVARTVGKPMAVVLSTSGDPRAQNAVLEAQQTCSRAGLPAYPTIGRAARAISRFISYYENRIG